MFAGTAPEVGLIKEPFVGDGLETTDTRIGEASGCGLTTDAVAAVGEDFRRPF